MFLDFTEATELFDQKTPSFPKGSIVIEKQEATELFDQKTLYV